MTALTPPATEAAPAPAAAVPRPRGGMFSLLLKGAALSAVAAASVFAFMILAPDGNDYAEASNRKHAVLAAIPSRKIVLVGGSNLAFGIDREMIKTATRCPVANMGINGYFGVRFMLNEVRPSLKSGDIVVIALEYDSFYKSVDGTGTDLLMVTKSNPAVLQYLTLGQQLEVIKSYPFAAQQKLLRLLDDMRGRPPLEGPDISVVESMAGHTAEGDLIGHLDIEYPGGRENGVDMVNTPLDPGVIPLLAAFNNEMKAKGVRVLMSFSPVIDYFYAQQKSEINRVDRLLQEAGLDAPRRASAFVFPPSQHFDTVYHLNREGRAIRTQMLVDDIFAQFGPAAHCEPATPPTITPTQTGASQ